MATTMSSNYTLNEASQSSPDTFWGHFTAGFFLCVFGGAYLALTACRWRRIIINTDDGTTFEHSLQFFLKQHIPEQNPHVLLRVSKALVFSSIFGVLYEGLGARFLNHDLNPDWTFFHYTTHLTLTLFYLLSGWTGLLEYWKVLPPDSLRASVAFALLGETLLWYEHASSKSNAVDGRIHAYLSFVSLVTAICIIASILHNTNTITIFPLFLYISGFVGIVWQGLWFFVAAVHQKYRISSTEHVTVWFCFIGIALIYVGQLVVLCLQKPSKSRGCDADDDEYSLLMKNGQHGGNVNIPPCSTLPDQCSIDDSIIIRVGGHGHEL